MPEASSTPPPGGITARAVQAAAERRRGTADPATWRDARWSERAEACVREVAALLGITGSQVNTQPDHTRAYGGWPWPLLTVTEPDGTEHRFVGAYNNPDQIFALGACPACGREVPITWLRTLADYGSLLDRTALAKDRFDPVAEFRGDPGHATDCPHADLP